MFNFPSRLWGPRGEKQHLISLSVGVTECCFKANNVFLFFFFPVFPGVGSTFFCRGRLLFFFSFREKCSSVRWDFCLWKSWIFTHLFHRIVKWEEKCQLERVFLPENFPISACYIRNEKKTPKLSLGGRLGRFLHRKTAVKALCSLDVITTLTWVKC